MPTNANSLQGGVDVPARADSQRKDLVEEKRGKLREQLARAREKPEISPRIEIVLNRQEEDLFWSAAMAKLSAIGVLLPFNVAEQFPIGRTKRDEVATAAMVRPEDQFPCGQLIESKFDVGRTKSRAIPADRDHFVISKLGDFFDSVLKAACEIPARLPVNERAGSDRIASRREKVNIHRR